MIDQLRDALIDSTQLFSDTRTHLCAVDVTALTNGRCILTGTVLDAETRDALIAALTARFSGVIPDLLVDVSNVRVLRAKSPTIKIVATNLTGLYAQPSFGAEQVSQLRNGEHLEVLRHQTDWTFVRQADSYLGWVYTAYLVDAPSTPTEITHLVCAPITPLRTEPQLFASVAGRVLGGTAVTVERMVSLGNRAYDGWAFVTLANGRTGWLSIFDLRNLDELPGDVPSRRRQIVQDARAYSGVPYLWGGSSGMGIDCSGLAQLTHLLSGIILPRDADMQFEVGRTVQPPFQAGDLLFFGSEEAKRRITHVGISLGGWQIIHASRAQNGVYVDDVQAVDHLRESFMGARSFLSK